MRNGRLKIFSALLKIHKSGRYISCLFWHCVRRMTLFALLKWTPLLIYTARTGSFRKMDDVDKWKMVGDLCWRVSEFYLEEEKWERWMSLEIWIWMNPCIRFKNKDKFMRIIVNMWYKQLDKGQVLGGLSMIISIRRAVRHVIQIPLLMWTAF